MKVLIIEDEKDLSESISTYLKSEHFTCETAFDFREALEKISIYDYACIILDINLPEGNGLTLLKELKKNQKGRRCPDYFCDETRLDDKITWTKVRRRRLPDQTISFI